MLAPGGLLGAVDFHVSPSHGALARAFWRRWFAHAGVRLSADHLSCLRDRLETIACSERSGKVPYLPGLRAPYYVFVGRRRSTPGGG
jgi:S-adenosylmethionine-diacylgycerolhomoserine-N-methlytransferase